MAFIVEQAGGRATDGRKTFFLSEGRSEVNQRAPIYIGSAAEVAMAGEFLSQSL